MENFKILFPAGYNITEISADNIDVNVLLSNGFFFILLHFYYFKHKISNEYY